MRHSTNKLLLLFFSICLIKSSAQSNYQLKFKRFNAEDYGINFISASHLTANNEVYMGTNEGIACFNGYTFKHIFKGFGLDKNLLSKAIHQIYVDKKNNLWLGYEDVAALTKVNLNNKQVTHFKHDTVNANSFPECIPSAFYEIGNSNELWITTWGGGIIRMNINSNQFEVINKSKKPKNASHWFESDYIRTLTKLNGEDYLATYFQESSNGKMLPCVYNIKNNTVSPYPFNDFKKNTNEKEFNVIQNMLTICHFAYVDKSSNIWIGTYSGLILIDVKNKILKRITGKKITIGEGVNAENVLNYVVDSNDNLIFGTGNSGLMLVDPKTEKVRYHINKAYDQTSISGNTIKNIFIDGFGNMWAFCTTIDFNVQFQYNMYLTQKSWESLKVEPINASARPIPSEMIYSDNKGLVYIANKNGINIYSPEKDSLIEILKFNHPSENGTYASSIYTFRVTNDILYTLARNKLKDYNFYILGYNLKTKKICYNANKFNFMFEFYFNQDSTSDIYSCCRNNTKISKYNFNKHGFDTIFKLESKYKIQGNTTINFENKKFVFGYGQKHFANTGFIVVDIETGKPTLFSSDEFNDVKIPNLTIHNITHNRKGVFYYATNKGIFEFNSSNNQFTYKNKEFGLDTMSFSTVVLTPDNKLWFTKMDKIYVHDFNSKKTTVFDKRTELNIDGFNSGFLIKETSFDSKYIYFPTAKGLAIVDYKHYRLPQEKAILNCYQLSINDSIASDSLMSNIIRGEYKLNHEDNNLNFHINSNQIVTPSANLFEYKLSGHDKKWINIGSNNQINLQNLSPGNYTLQVKCLNSYNIESEILNIKFQINKPFYLTWWFICIIIITIILLVYFLIKTREKDLILKQQKLENIIYERTSEITVKAKEIEHQKFQLEEKQKEIIDSIRYAKRIQQALLATKSVLDRNLNNYFVYYNPKDIVSGDFYWATNHHNLFYLIVADSTGHGVPGAFMSLLNINYLHEAINEKQILEPANILNYVRTRLINSLAEDGSEEGGKDGMDCSLLCFNFERMELQYACAYNSILLIRDNQLLELECDRMPVGKGPKGEISFRNYSIEIKPNDLLFALTDGYADQFGGATGKKLKYKNLKNYILKNSQLSLIDQKIQLENSFNEWRGNIEQIDDVCIFGIKI
ncbi:MAG: SpoIIE family protein phosphatase [Bacteroidota bacterium]